MKQWLCDFALDMYFDGVPPEWLWGWLVDITFTMPDMSDCTPLEEDETIPF